MRRGKGMRSGGLLAAETFNVQRPTFNSEREEGRAGLTSNLNFYFASPPGPRTSQRRTTLSNDIAMMTSAQKKARKSLKVPIGGVPGWLLRSAGKAKRSAPRNENIEISILRCPAKTRKTRKITPMARAHIAIMMNTEKKTAVVARWMLMSITV